MPVPCVGPSTCRWDSNADPRTVCIPFSRSVCCIAGLCRIVALQRVSCSVAPHRMNM
ncbi:hypothetical protein L207DRAFT_517090 [Hyaloscypha variabilis F]|uniref:Uncharacterized protein n=1 Tax=Hyaloscypha variabilis (strain UAMH 11265 / GT02V1 / F) TaxID=1149755 RepID=A0A2J6R8Y9_HYAVF|nr:hypothetical protein L207DRAFT_517090 [Hyaloscypha variabilis F]